MDFETYLQGEKQKAATVSQHVRNAGYFLAWLEREGHTLQQATHHEVLDFTDALRREGSSVNQTNRVLLSLRYYFAWLNKEGTASGNPASGLKVRGAVRTVPTGLLEREELDSLHEKYTVTDDRTHRNKTILGLLVHQGITREELETLRPEHLKLREGKLHIPQTNKNNARILTLEPHQILDLQEYALAIRPKLGGDPQRLFMGRDGNPSLNNTLLHLCHALRRIDPRVRNATQLRQSVITEWLKTKNLRQVQYMAGHRYVSSTERYLTTSLEDLREALEKHHPLK
ncbi:tyrosine-type recombinase/integrase [Parapedobacter sp. GCM10030251]|uniref:tyrosine-type recombinase/integrase n=1 Tax=Parapedobacter sp. GCM10030251 TaxID=3273419 RepID=UPI00360EABA8